MIDTNFAKLIDDNSRIRKLFILEQLIQDGRLTATEKSGDDSNGLFFGLC